MNEWTLATHERHGTSWMAVLVRKCGDGEVVRFVAAGSAAAELRRLNAEGAP